MVILPRAGAYFTEESQCRFVLWAPFAQEVRLHILSPLDQMYPMERDERGYHQVTLPDVAANTRYMFHIAGRDFPDPASRSQPDGVHGASEVIRLKFRWRDNDWRGHAQSDLIIYELHVGAFTPEGTFAALTAQLDYLVSLGITAIELMPICQFPGERNWGYDGVGLYAVQHSYGRAEDLCALVDECHQRHISVILDMVYNHFGPEGCYLMNFGPYFTDKYKGSWGAALNFDGAGSDSVRQFFIQNALYWVDEFHIDGFRLDAIDHIVDTSALSFWEELSAALHQHANDTGRPCWVFAESDQNNARLTRPQTDCGVGLDGQWLYDFHHTLFPLLVDEPIHYYVDFTRFDNLVTLFRDGFVYQGQYSLRRGRRWGTPADSVEPARLIAYMQTHDRVGNRPYGERLGHLVTFEALKLSAACVLLSPFTPLLFMGEEYAETAPFQFFTDFSDPQLAEQVARGRLDDAHRRGYPVSVPLPDPNNRATFERSRMNLDLRHSEPHRLLFDFYQELIGLRKSLSGLSNIDALSFEPERVLMVRRWHHERQVIMVFNVSDQPQVVTFDAPAGLWITRLNSSAARWQPAPENRAVIDQYPSDGALTLELARWSAVVLEHAG